MKNAPFETMKRRAALVFICVPVVLVLMLADAVCAAWGEFRTDWRDAKDMFLGDWRGE